MTKIIRGNRIGKEGNIRLGCSAVIFDDTRRKVLLTRRADNGEWCLPSGGAEPGESVTETCAREVLEETGLQVEVGRLTGVYSDPDLLVIYEDGTHCQIVALNFEATIVAGVLRLSDETTEYGYFGLDEAAYLPMLGNHLQRIRDAFAKRPTPFIR